MVHGHERYLKKDCVEEKVKNHALMRSMDFNRLMGNFILLTKYWKPVQVALYPILY